MEETELSRGRFAPVADVGHHDERTVVLLTHYAGRKLSVLVCVGDDFYDCFGLDAVFGSGSNNNALSSCCVRVRTRGENVALPALAPRSLRQFRSAAFWCQLANAKPYPVN